MRGARFQATWTLKMGRGPGSGEAMMTRTVAVISGSALDDDQIEALAVYFESLRHERR